MKILNLYGGGGVGWRGVGWGRSHDCVHLKPTRTNEPVTVLLCSRQLDKISFNVWNEPGPRPLWWADGWVELQSQ